MDVVEFMARLGLRPEIHSHPAVMTVAESLAFVSGLPGCKTKNLFLRDKKRRRHFLVVVPHDAGVDLRALGQVLGVTGLGLASHADLGELMGVTPGAVSILCAVNDTARAVDVVVDAMVWTAEAVQAHPLDNSRTAVLTHSMLERFLAATGHVPRVIVVPRLPPAGA